VRSDAANLPLVPSQSGSDGGRSWIDEQDAATAWADLTKLDWRGTRGEQPYWFLQLASKPPRTADLQNGTVLEYGVVLEMTGDGVPDYEIGLSNDAPRAGEFRLWVANLATGATVEKVGRPYGFPVEFRHPDEAGADDPPSWATTVMFTFLTGTEPPGIGAGTRYYAWASHSENGELVSWDYAPDNGWLKFTTTPYITIQNLTASVARGEWASLSIKTVPNATCSIAITYDRGMTDPAGEEVADPSGNVNISWRVGTDEAPGTYPLDINCSVNGLVETLREQFQVR
jgi:hypothetical protein